MSNKVKSKVPLMDKDVLCGDEVIAKIAMKKKTKKKKVTAIIKWKGRGAFFGPGIWYRVDVDSKRYFFQKEAVVKNISAKKRALQLENQMLIETTGNKKRKKKVKKTKWTNIHFVGCPDITKKNKNMKMFMSLEQSSTFEIAPIKDENEDDDKDDEKHVDLNNLADISLIGGMQTMGRKRSESLPKPHIKHIKNKLSVNEIYSLKGVESRSIRIHIDPNKFTVAQLKSYIIAKFKIPVKCNCLLMYNNCTLSMKDKAISYYGVDNHSCLLLCISEFPSTKKTNPSITARNRSSRRRNNSTIPRNRNSSINASNQSRRNRATSALPRNTRNTRNLSNESEGGIIGIASNALAPPNSISDTANGAMVSIMNDKSEPFRKRLNKFCSKFVIRRMSALDIYTFDVDHNSIQMPCGHGMTKESLFAYAKAQFRDHKKALKCPHLKEEGKNTLCKATWHFQLVRKILLSGESKRISINEENVEASRWIDSMFGVIVIGYLRNDVLLTRFTADVLLKIYQYSLDKKREAILRRPYMKTMMGLEIDCAKNKFIDSYDYQKCINCSLFIYRKQVPIDQVKCFCLCPLCESKFCWLCSNEWKTRNKAKHCGNNECTISWTKQHLTILQKCKTKTIGSVSGIPEVRACPKCNELIFHVTACKHMSCRSCKTQFCFCCMKKYRNSGGWQCGSSSTVCPVAPRQKLNCLTNTNRGHVELFKLLH